MCNRREPAHLTDVVFDPLELQAMEDLVNRGLHSCLIHGVAPGTAYFDLPMEFFHPANRDKVLVLQRIGQKLCSLSLSC